MFAALLLARALSPNPLAQIEPTPRLILVLAIDQMRFDYLTRFDNLYEGGLRTLIDEGAIFTNARYRHSVTETGPGHSVILSGRHPSSSGIVGNEWYDILLKEEVNVVGDMFATPLGGPGRPASPVNMVGFTLGDVLKQSSPESKVVGVSLKDRSAILMAGRLGDAAYWYETVGGDFITSSYYMEAAPDWLNQWNQMGLIERFRGRQWTRMMDDLSLYERYAGPDSVEGERDRDQTRDATVFPHEIFSFPPADESEAAPESEQDADTDLDLAEEPDPESPPRRDPFYGNFRRTPFADEITMEVALRAMEAHQVGDDQFLDILAIGLSGTDIVGHSYGDRSQEVMDQLLRLDLLLGYLFEEIESRVGMDETLVVLTADHGVMPLAETAATEGTDSRRTNRVVFAEAIDAAFAGHFEDPSGFVAQMRSTGDGIYLDLALIVERGIERSEVEEIIIDALMGTGLVAAVYTQADLVSEAPSLDPYIEFYRNSFFSSRSPHLSIRLNPYVFMANSPDGTGHGSPYDYDRHIPIVLMGPGVQPGTYAEDSGPEDIAPTLAEMLGLEYPIEPDARILNEALR